MSELDYKVHVKRTSDSAIWECTCYTTTAEATLTSNDNYWELKNNEVICYIGLLKKGSSVPLGCTATPLIIKKSGTGYYALTNVIRYYTFTINQSDNETIRVTCGGTVYDSSFTYSYGQTWTASVTANSSSYNAGTLSATSGVITGNTSISVGAATQRVQDTDTALVNEFISRNKIDDAKYFIGGMIYDVYFTLNKDEWIN